MRLFSSNTSRSPFSSLPALVMVGYTKVDDEKMWKSLFLCFSTIFGCFVDDFIARVHGYVYIKKQQKLLYGLLDSNFVLCRWISLIRRFLFLLFLRHKREKRINKYISASVFIWAALHSVHVCDNMFSCCLYQKMRRRVVGGEMVPREWETKRGCERERRGFAANYKIKIAFYVSFGMAMG